MSVPGEDDDVVGWIALALVGAALLHQRDCKICHAALPILRALRSGLCASCEDMLGSFGTGL